MIPQHDQQDADPAVVAAIAGVRPIRLAAVLVPIIDRDEPSVLFTRHTTHLRDHAGHISFPGGKIDANDESPGAARGRGGDRAPSPPCSTNRLSRRSHDAFRLSHFASVRLGFALHFNKGEVDDAFEVPLAFLMTPQNHKRESRNWKGLTIALYAIPFDGRNIWGATAAIIRNLYERVYRD